MSKPKTTARIKPLYQEEADLMQAIEAESYTFGKSTLTPKRKQDLHKAARNTLNDERVQIS